MTRILRQDQNKDVNKNVNINVNHLFVNTKNSFTKKDQKTQKYQSLKVLTWNAYSLNNKFSELKTLIATETIQNIKML